ncbi:NirD/YgiW/YdeI family stress tolerance protein [Castellaniella sp. GW247-6E4]|uniref:YgiW/YdeI family stress tolerance OB fold protein n=1 Tax=Castellaniella sp. GW247-6E4 TaxID=3140380 RepID=UPI003316043D
MRHIIFASAAAAVLTLGTVAVAIAQPAGYTGPSNTGKAAQGAYSGPADAPLMTVKQLLETGRDDQIARLQGRIISFEGNERYIFEDATGRMTVEIDAEDFPTGQTINAEHRVELVGELDKGLRKTEFEVDRVTLLP